MVFYVSSKRNNSRILNNTDGFATCDRSYPIIRLAEVIDTLGLEPRHPVPAFGSANTHPSGSLSSKRSIPLGPQFSLDLVAAVKRQASFIAQVAAVGWTQPRPKGIEAVVASSIDKYHGFLKKLWENPEALAVPTLVRIPCAFSNAYQITNFFSRRKL